jgi:tRNA(Ile)-lysidine synthetase-like protein
MQERMNRPLARGPDAIASCAAEVEAGAEELAGELTGLDGARVLVALSGGADSTALLLWLIERRLDVAAAHYDHALRPGSERDADHVWRLCRALGVELITERRQAPLSPGSLQAAAREARYDFFERARATSRRDLVATAHTADDVVEGALIHLLRGASLAGLRGVPARRGPYVRPFLGVWRADIERYLATRGLEPLRDPSNADRRFLRARVRHDLLPQLERDRPGLTRRLHAVAGAAAELQARLEWEASRLSDRKDALAAAPRPIRLEAYRQLYAGAGGPLPGLGRRQLEAMDALLGRGRTGAGVDLPGGLRFRLGRRAVSVGPRRVDPGPRPALRARPCAGCREPGAVHLRPGLELTVGYRRPGLRMRPLRGWGLHSGSRKLQDILTDAGVPRHLRDRWPLVFAGGRLAWVPGIAVDASLAAPPGTMGTHLTMEGEPEGWC